MSFLLFLVLVLLPADYRVGDVPLLPLLCPAREQDDQFIAFLSKLGNIYVTIPK
jgi:hypothetical protein